MKPELYRPIMVARIPSGGLDVTVEADAAECRALAERMNLPAVLSLTCRFHVDRDAGGILLAHGHLLARVEQTCIVSLEDFATTVEERFIVRFVTEEQENDETDPLTPDEIVIEDGVLDLGEAAAEQLALALDPYPRAPGAVLPDMPEEPESHPFAALDALRRKH